MGLFCYQLFQDFQRFLLAPVAVLTAGSYTGGTAVAAGTVADQLQGAGHELLVHLKELLAEPDPGRDGII